MQILARTTTCIAVSRNDEKRRGVRGKILKLGNLRARRPCVPKLELEIELAPLSWDSRSIMGRKA